jgi:hypothetical protein
MDKVMFKITEGEVIAIFPALAGDSSPATCLSYMRVGQHGACSIDFVRKLKWATPEQYASLKVELESIGYELKLVRRFTRADLESRLKQIKGV